MSTPKGHCHNLRVGKNGNGCGSITFISGLISKSAYIAMNYNIHSMYCIQLLLKSIREESGFGTESKEMQIKNWRVRSQRVKE